MFDRPSVGHRVVMVHIDFPDQLSPSNLAEFKELIISAGGSPVAMVGGARATPDAKYFVGGGKAEEIREAVLAEEADLVIFNHSLSPSQERNLEALIKARVLDRTGLILDIFAQRARSFEGKLQVELAQLNHLATRLVRGWTHLERQKGGIGLRGPGETQLETDRRLLQIRIKTLNKRLQKVRKQRDQSRQARYRAAIPAVSVVGYTNAGKSTLFNALTGADTYAANQLFATLDPTSRRLELPGAGSAILADTVGFISDLPHDLVAAFRATLEETRDANLLLHVIDLSDANWREHIEQVDLVLTEINASHVPQIHVFNKIDALTDMQAKLEYDQENKPNKIWLSAKTGVGIDLLKSAISKQLYGDPVYRSLCLNPNQGKLRAELYQLGAVLDEHSDEQGNWLISVCMAKADYERLINVNLEVVDMVNIQ